MGLGLRSRFPAPRLAWTRRDCRRENIHSQVSDSQAGRGRMPPSQHPVQPVRPRAGRRVCQIGLALRRHGCSRRYRRRFGRGFGRRRFRHGYRRGLRVRGGGYGFRRGGRGFAPWRRQFMTAAPTSSLAFSPADTFPAGGLKESCHTSAFGVNIYFAADGHRLRRPAETALQKHVECGHLRPGWIIHWRSAHDGKELFDNLGSVLAGKLGGLQGTFGLPPGFGETMPLCQPGPPVPFGFPRFAMPVLLPVRRCSSLL